jgi:hypothetical protein
LLLRKQRSGGSKFAASPGKYFKRPYLKKKKKKITKKELVKCRPEFKPQYQKQKKRSPG